MVGALDSESRGPCSFILSNIHACIQMVPGSIILPWPCHELASCPGRVEILQGTSVYFIYYYIIIIIIIIIY